MDPAGNSSSMRPGQTYFCSEMRIVVDFLTEGKYYVAMDQKTLVVPNTGSFTDPGFTA
jgi:membrane-bound inhibitor of C-type lysozyme